MRTTSSLFLAAALLGLAPAAAFAADSAVAPSAHQGLAFATSRTAKARIVEPDGRILLTDSVSDLVAPSAIAERQAKTAIIQLIRATVPAKGAARVIREAAKDKAVKPARAADAPLQEP
jgi:hypothetical protein